MRRRRRIGLRGAAQSGRRLPRLIRGRGRAGRCWRRRAMRGRGRRGWRSRVGRRRAGGRARKRVARGAWRRAALVAVPRRALMAVPVRRRRTKHRERGIGTTEQSDARHDQRAHQQDASSTAKHAHQTTPLSRWISEDRSGLLRLAGVGLERPVGTVPLDHEASLGEVISLHGRKRRCMRKSVARHSAAPRSTDPRRPRAVAEGTGQRQ